MSKDVERYWSALTDSALFMPERTPEEGRPVCSTASVEGDPKILKEENTYGKDDFSAASAYECQGCSLRRKPGGRLIKLNELNRMGWQLNLPYVPHSDFLKNVRPEG